MNPDIVDAPFGSHVDFVLDSSGSPILLMNEISMHTVNIDQSAKGSGTLVTLFAQLPVGEGQSVSRVSVTGTIAKVPETSEELEAMKMSFSIAHSYYDQIASSPKFSFYKLTPVKIYYVGGFGVQSSWVDIKDYESAQADIIAKEGERAKRSESADDEDEHTRDEFREITIQTTSITELTLSHSILLARSSLRFASLRSVKARPLSQS